MIKLKTLPFDNSSVFFKYLSIVYFPNLYPTVKVKVFNLLVE